MTDARRLWLVFGPGALAAGGLAIALAVTSDHAKRPVLDGTLRTLVGWSFVAAGLVAWSRRPANRTGRLLVAVGMTWFLSALVGANSSVPFTLGLALSNIFLAVLVHLLVAFPGGDLRTRAERGVVALAYVTATLASPTLLLFERRPDACDRTPCPESAFYVGHHHLAHQALTTLWDGLGVVIAAFVVWTLARRWRDATKAARRVLGPVYLSGGAMFLLLLGNFASDQLSRSIRDAFSNLALVAFISLPYFFLAGLLRTRLARADVGRFFADVSENPSGGELRAGFRRILRDPSADLVHWLPERATYVDLEGNRFEPGDDRVTTPIEYEGRRLGALVHDASLLEERELLEAAAATARIGLEKDRLSAELRARLVELERERDFVRAVVDTAPAVFCVVDREGRVMRFNQMAERLSGLHDDERSRGRLFWELFLAPEDAEDARAAIAAGVPRVQHESVWLDRRGGRHVVAWSLTPLLDAQGRPRYLITGTDVTDRKRQEEELRRSRARIVEATDFERRRLERNLHDGAQQRLVSLSLALRLAQSRLKTDPEGAHELLARASEELAQALEELRELARGIHPAVLTDRGLAAAVDALAARAPLPVEIERVPAERLPGPIEAAAYYVIAEGLTNVVKYANASSVRVSVLRRDGRALVEIADDGVGGADPARGSGLRGLADRVEALDGRLEVESEPGGGTRLRAEIPV